MRFIVTKINLSLLNKLKFVFASFYLQNLDVVSETIRRLCNNELQAFKNYVRINKRPYRSQKTDYVFKVAFDAKNITLQKS